MDVESLVISLGLDPANFRNGLAQVEGGFQNFVRSIAAMAAPLLGAISVGAMVDRYMGDAAQVAQMTGRWTSQQEEWIKKRELLSRITREDIELYRKGKLALLNFDAAMAGLSTTIMRRLSPVIQGGIDRLNAVSDWVRKNENNIIRFVTVLAATITAVLTPAFVKMGIAMLANPLTWIIAGILLLALVIDDLLVYIRGGESAFGEFWAIFGTGEEILDKLRSTWKSFLDSMSRFKNLIPYIVSGAAAFAGYKAVSGVLSGVVKAVNFVKSAFMALRVVMATNPLGAFLLIAALIIVYWDDIVAAIRKGVAFIGEYAGKAKALIMDAIGKAADWIKEKWAPIGDFFSKLWDGITKKISAVKEKLKGMIPDWMKEWLGVKDGEVDVRVGEPGNKETRETSPGNASPLGRALARQASPVSPFALPPLQIPQGAVPTGPQLTQAAVPASLTTNNDNRRDVKVDAQFHTTINAPGADADALADKWGAAVNRRMNNLDIFPAEGAVRQ